MGFDEATKAEIRKAYHMQHIPFCVSQKETGEQVAQPTVNHALTRYGGYQLRTNEKGKAT